MLPDSGKDPVCPEQRGVAVARHALVVDRQQRAVGEFHTRGVAEVAVGAILAQGKLLPALPSVLAQDDPLAKGRLAAAEDRNQGAGGMPQQTGGEPLTPRKRKGLQVRPPSPESVWTIEKAGRRPVSPS